MSELVDSNPIFGSTHKFEFGKDKLIISKKGSFSYKEVRSIPLTDIKSIEYYKADGTYVLKRFFLGKFLSLLITEKGGDTYRNYLKISYLVDGNDAEGGFDSSLSDEDIAEMNRLIEKAKKTDQKMDDSQLVQNENQ